MMSASKRTHCRYSSSVLLLVCCCVALAHEGNAAQDVASLASKLSAEEYYVGEPVDLMVQLSWDNSEPGIALVTSQNFLEIEVRSRSGEVLATPLDWVELAYDVEDNVLDDRTIILTQEQPRWSVHIQLNRRFCFDTPNEFLVRVAWITPTEEKVELNAKLVAKVPDGTTARLLHEVHAPVTEGSFVVRCPAAAVDRAAFELLAGKPCPQAMASLDSVSWSVARLREVLVSFPDSVYAGYALARGAGAIRYPARPGESLVGMLGSGRFLREHPTMTVILDPPRAEGDKLVETEEVQTERRVREHLSQVSKFVNQHPAFVLREKLEMMMGFDALALDQAGQAASHWRWVRQNGHDEKLVDRAARGLVELEQFGLLPIEQ